MSDQFKQILSSEQKDGGLKGDLSSTNIADLLQFLSSSSKKGVIKVVRHPDKEQGQVYFDGGELVSAISGKLTGLTGFADLLGWQEGSFRFFPGVDAQNRTVGLSVQHAILEAMVSMDHGTGHVKEQAAAVIEERGKDMELAVRGATEVMNDLLEVPGIDAVVIVGRDGFVIDSTGSSLRVNIDVLGASLAHAVNGIEEMGTELNINQFQDLFIEYGRSVIMCKPVGDAIAAVVTPDASKLGIIRHKTKKLFQELGQSF